MSVPIRGRDVPNQSCAFTGRKYMPFASETGSTTKPPPTRHPPWATRQPPSPTVLHPPPTVECHPPPLVRDGGKATVQSGRPVRPLRRQVVNQQMVRKVLVVHDEAGGIRADGALPVRAQELVHALHVLLHVRLGPEVDVLHHPVPPLDREDVVGLREQVHARRLLQSGQQVPRLLHLRDHALLQGLP